VITDDLTNEEILYLLDLKIIEPLAAKIKRLFETYHGATGGCLHVVIEDGNAMDSHIERCLEGMEPPSPWEDGHQYCRGLALDLPEFIRDAAVDRYWERRHEP
jgi:hypothetical protein